MDRALTDVSDRELSAIEGGENAFLTYLRNLVDLVTGASQDTSPCGGIGPAPAP